MVVMGWVTVLSIHQWAGTTDLLNIAEIEFDQKSGGYSILIPLSINVNYERASTMVISYLGIVAYSNLVWSDSNHFRFRFYNKDGQIQSGTVRYWYIAMGLA